MNVARFAAAPLAVALSLLTACSDPPAPPAQGAVSLKVGVTPGKICSHTNGQISMPMNVAGVLESLNCDLSQGCKPDEYVVVNRDRGTTVTCTVAPNGNNFNVSARLSVDGTSTGDVSLNFGITGNNIGPTGGGPVGVTQLNSVSMGGGKDDACTLSINAPRGLIKKGGVWGSVHCDNFVNPTDISETGCTLDATFLFENCDG
jgi:hypothetical protein